jgi:hypothetical protein
MRSFPLIFAFLICMNCPTLAQKTDTLPKPKGQSYFSSGGEIIFSFARVKYQGSTDGSKLRFSPFFNIQSYFNYDASDYFGYFAGFTLRNAGFIYEFPDTDTKKKYRNYQVGFPVGIKLGRMNRTFLYFGYEPEFPFHYKEKTFRNGDKVDKFSIWFSNRTPRIYHAVLAGIQLPYATNLKFKYYLSGFFNRDFQTVENGNAVFPYQNLQAHVFYISLSFNLLRNTELSFGD